jgi:hypothetical protein
MKFNTILLSLLLFGIVDQINDDKVVVEYESNGRVMYSTVSLSQSACTPVEGQPVFFFEDYKIVSCEAIK